MAEAFDPYLSWLGIEPHERPLDHYRLLGLPRFEHRREAILAAADQRMAFVRSFQSGPRVAHTQKLLNELATAKLCLLDTQAKATYDATLRMRLYSAPPPAPPPVVNVTVAAPPLSTQPTSSVQVASPMQVIQPAVSSALASEASAGTADADATPFYAQVWFPLAVVGAVLIVGGLVWGVSRVASLMRTAPPVAEAPEAPPPPDEPEPPPPAPVETIVLLPEATGEIHIPADRAELHGALRLESQGEAGVLANWRSVEDDWASWEFRVQRPGIFHVDVTYSLSSGSAGGRFEVQVDQERKSAETRSAAKPDEFVTDRLLLAIKKGGRHTLVLRLKEVRGQDLFVLKSLTLTPRPTGKTP